MGYVIRYCDSNKKSNRSQRTGPHLAALTAAFFLAFLLLTRAFWPAGAAVLRGILLPGDPEVTGRAISGLLEDIRAGQPLGESVTAFCSEILTNAEHPN